MEPKISRRRRLAQLGLLDSDGAKALCDTAQAAWGRASKRATRVRFVWEGRAYSSSLSQFRMCVWDERGAPVACRWHNF